MELTATDQSHYSYEHLIIFRRQFTLMSIELALNPLSEAFMWDFTVQSKHDLLQYIGFISSNNNLTISISKSGLSENSAILSVENNRNASFSIQYHS